MLTISARAIGRRKPIFDDFTVPPPVASATGDPITLRDLITHVVRAEVGEFQTRQADHRLLKAMSAKQIAEGLAAGKVSPGGADLDQAVDAERAAATALGAFTDGLFLVVVDGEEVRELGATVALTPESALVFVRLTLLAGG